MACEDDKTSPEIRPNLLEIVVLYPKVPQFLGHRWGFYGGLATRKCSTFRKAPGSFARPMTTMTSPRRTLKVGFDKRQKIGCLADKNTPANERLEHKCRGGLFFCSDACFLDLQVIFRFQPCIFTGCTLPETTLPPIIMV